MKTNLSVLRRLLVLAALTPGEANASIFGKKKPAEDFTVVRAPMTPRCEEWNAREVWQWCICEITRVTTDAGFVGYGETLLNVILPQALRNMLPSLVNQLVSTIKETSLGYIISLPEVSFVAGQISTAVMIKSAEVYGLLAISYFVMCFSLTRVAFFLERRLAAHAPSKP